MEGIARRTPTRSPFNFTSSASTSGMLRGCALSSTRDLMIHLMAAAHHRASRLNHDSGALGDVRMKRLIKVLLTVLFGRPRTPPWPWENPPRRRLAATSGRKHLRGFRLD
jgi:hypothetical protein